MMGARSHAVQRWTGGTVAAIHEAVAEEVPVALVYNGISHAVMLATPADLEDFAVGFSLSEGIVDRYAAIRDVDATSSDAGITVDIAIPSAAFAALKARRRNLAGRTGCGLCGTESLTEVLRPVRPVTSGFAMEADILQVIAASLQRLQPLHAETGAVHAAAWGSARGSIALVREDVGRHNALDKLIGAMARQRHAFDHGACVLTSRASSEMIQKAAMVGMPIVAAISAPTGLAIRIAEESGVALVAWLRAGRLAVFAHGERLRGTRLECAS